MLRLWPARPDHACKNKSDSTCSYDAIPAMRPYHTHANWGGMGDTRPGACSHCKKLKVCGCLMVQCFLSSISLISPISLHHIPSSLFTTQSTISRSSPPYVCVCVCVFIGIGNRFGFGRNLCAVSASSDRAWVAFPGMTMCVCMYVCVLDEV